MNNNRPTLSELFDLNWSDIIVVLAVMLALIYGWLALLNTV